MITDARLHEVQRAIAEAGLDGWLLFDFRGINPIAQGLLGIEGMVTRRYFCYLPREGSPVAITHAIEQGPWQAWPAAWEKRVYSGWRALEKDLGEVINGKRVAMEYSPGDAIPYVDRIPAGVLDMVRAAGATVVSSADLITKFYAVWGDGMFASHERAAAELSRIARNAFALAGERARAGSPMREYELATLIRSEFADAKLFTDHGPNVSVGANAANPHYEPTEESSSLIQMGDILLIDLWAHEENGIYADQTWMASLGTPSERDQRVWEAVRGARDAAIARLKEKVAAGAVVQGGEIDDAAREFIIASGFGEYILHRTGHSIDSRDLHGSGPHIDNLETREERRLLPGVGFSIEPGVYIAGDVGMRSEVNGYMGDGEIIITPYDMQQDLIIA